MRHLVVCLSLAQVGCGAVVVDQAERCAAVNARMHECLGEAFPDIECAGTSAADLDAFDSALEDSECDYWRDALPQDGDLKASFCRLYGEGCTPAAQPTPEFLPTRYPVVFVNGIDVSFAFRYSERIFAVMRERGGHDVHFAVVPPYEGVPSRTRVLWAHVQDILQETGAEKVNLICHSLGGLDCRYLVSPGGVHWEIPAGHQEIVHAVASVTTVSTAHRGTRVADAALGYLPDTESTDAISGLATFVGDWFTDEVLTEDVDLQASLIALSESQARAFNEAVVDAEGVYYQSWGGFSRPMGLDSEIHDEQLKELCRDEQGALSVGTFTGDHDYLALSLVGSYEIVGRSDPSRPDALIPNDGLCYVTSARWGHFRGCVPIDHMEQLGQLNLPDANVRNGFDVAWFYAGVAEELSRMGY